LFYYDISSCSRNALLTDRIKRNRIIPGRIKNGNKFIPAISGYKSLALNKPLITWDLEKYPEVMQISLHKLIPSETITINTGNTVTQYVVGDRPLGDALIYFFDPVITSKRITGNNESYGLLDYDAGYCSFNIIPVKKHF